MASGMTAKKPAQVLLLPASQSRWAITTLLRAGSPSGQLVPRGADQVWQDFLSTACCSQLERVKHEANGFSGALQPLQHNSLLPMDLEQQLHERLSLLPAS